MFRERPPSLGFAVAFVTVIALGACGDDSTSSGDVAGGGDATGTPDGSGSDTSGGGATTCELAYALVNAGGKEHGEGCEADAECMYSVCLKPGTEGNITNAKFGFCSRGCDCSDDNNSKIPADEKEDFDCLYPAGFAKRHHIVVECQSLADCTALDARWTECKLPDTGGARKVCHAL